MSITVTSALIKVKVPADSFDAVLIKWTFKGKVGRAGVDDTQYRFFAPGVGILARVRWW